MDYSKQKLTRLKYIIALCLIWSTIFITSFSFILSNEISEIEARYQTNHEKIFRHLTDTVKTFEVSVESFASVLSSEHKDESRYGKSRLFAKQIRSYYPDIYMFEIAKRILRNERSNFEENMHKSGYPDFVIHTFGYDADRKRYVSVESDVYYPIVLIEPELSEAKEVLGLDLFDSSSILKDTLERAFNKKTYVASRPFDLMEGHRGYILYREVGGNQGEINLEFSPEQDLYALLVVDASKLIPSWAYGVSGLSLMIRYKDIGIGDDAILVQTDRISENERNLNSWLLPTLSVTSELNNQSQPFELTSSYIIQWSDYELDTIIFFMIVALVTFPIAFWLSLLMYRRNMQISNKREKNFYLANYDSLTGLPNKNFAEELFNHSISILKRSENKLTVLYIDLDGFKQVNDRYGHHAGDKILNAVSDRLNGILRDTDTLARLHGDEFVIFLTDLVNPVNASTVIDHAKSAFKSPFVIENNHITIGLSIGVSTYPDDGLTFDELLSASDKKMYMDKMKGKKD